MVCQALEQAEVLSIRWAHDDPNPVAKDSIERADRDAMVALLKAKGVSLTASGFNYPAEYQMPEPKRLRIEEGGSILEQYPDLAYPDTDAQYEHYATLYGTNDQATTSESSASASEKSEAMKRLGIVYETEKEEEKHDVVDEKKETSGKVEDEGPGSEGGWQAHVDESTGATYYFNATTGESSWTKPV
jgi:hypothetical protein